jgi:hypothetical protein
MKDREFALGAAIVGAWHAILTRFGSAPCARSHAESHRRLPKKILLLKRQRPLPCRSAIYPPL